MRITRLAPSPTGALHLGNARTFLINWLLARQHGWRIVLRIDDIDGPRVKRGADRLALEDLRWLGLDADEGPVYQSTRHDAYRAALARLVEAGHVYPCTCSRREVELAASAPHADDGATIYPGTCRGRYKSIEDAIAQTGRAPALRFRVPEGVVEFHDAFAGVQRIEPAKQLGDFVIAKADGTPSYHLATVVDDADAGVTDVVRGDDLIDSTPRQMLIYRALGLSAKIPTYTHLPLVVGPDGKRLAKRHGDTRLEHYRKLGVPPGRVIELLARWCGVQSRQPVDSLDKLFARFRLADVPRERVVFTPEDDAFLRH
jgi:glutamyl-tRNA synthetase